VCKRMDMICQRVLNQGFLKVERYHSLCQRQVKAQLPRLVPHCHKHLQHTPTGTVSERKVSKHFTVFFFGPSVTRFAVSLIYFY
ncbi:hypothetical protein GOODEAATRI_030512, partial [Goodea atripinnis]